MAGFSPFQNAVQDQLEAQGWTIIKDGIPDFICIRGKEVKFVECKAHRDRLWPNQQRAIEALRGAGLAVEVERETLLEMKARMVS